MPARCCSFFNTSQAFYFIPFYFILFVCCILLDRFFAIQFLLSPFDFAAHFILMFIRIETPNNWYALLAGLILLLSVFHRIKCNQEENVNFFVHKRHKAKQKQNSKEILCGNMMIYLYDTHLTFYTTCSSFSCFLSIKENNANK